MLRSALLLLSLAGAARAQGWPLPPTDTGTLFVSGFASNNVGEFRKDGSLVRTITHPDLVQPRGVAVEHDGTIVVVVQADSRVMRFRPDGSLLQQVFHPDLTNGTGLSRSPNGNWYVANFSPGRILVFDPGWNHVTTVTDPGMNGVNCVSFDSDGSGDFAVTVVFGAKVMRFDAQHQLLGTVVHPAMASPMSIADDRHGAHYVSQGSSGRVIKFDAAWNPVTEIGLGTLASPQGIAVDEHDMLTISNFASSTVHRFDTAGNLVDSWTLTGVQTGRNLAWQTSPMMIARQGAVGTGSAADPEPVLRVAGQTGDGAHRVQLATTDAFAISMQAPTQATSPSWFALFVRFGEPGPADVVELPFGIGPMAFAPPFAGGDPLTLANNIGLESLLGAPLVPVIAAPTTVLSMPAGLGFPLTVTLQGVIVDPGSAGAPAVPFSTTNAITLVIG